MLSHATSHLIQVAEDRSSSSSAFQTASAEFFSNVGTATAEEVSRAIVELTSCFELEDPRRVAILGLICGALAEEGQNTSLFAKPLLDRFAAELGRAAELVAEIEPKLPPVKEGDTDEDEGDDDSFGDTDADIVHTDIEGVIDGDPLDDNEDDVEDDNDDAMDIREQLFEQERRSLGSDWRAEKWAWDSLEQFWPPVVLVLSHDAHLRRQYAYLARNAHVISEFHVAGYWLRTLLTVLDDEPIVVIEPSTKQGILARMSGVVDNFQLHMILMDIFPHAGLLHRRRIPKEVADLAKGSGPQNLDFTVTGAWNLYDWRAVQSNLQLPNPAQLEGMEYWIWNEGTPADIPTLNGRRVILLGPATYQRQWGAVRTFEHLPAEIATERTLNRNEVKEWLGQMKSTDR